MPSGPPVQPASLVSTMATSNPKSERRDGEIMSFEPENRPADQRRRPRPKAIAPANRHSHEGTPKWTGPMATE